VLLPLAETPAAASVGVGLAVPDAFSASGCWYVSPWTAGAAPRAAWPALPRGRWAAREDALPLAVLPLDGAAQDGVEAGATVASFLAAALAAAARALDPRREGS
jgi:hypothetical protein